MMMMMMMGGKVVVPKLPAFAGVSWWSGLGWLMGTEEY